MSWLWCVRAGRISLPRDATDAVWSPSAFACYLYSQQFIPLARIRELLTALYGHAPSEPTVLAAARQLASHTQTSLEQIRQQLLAAPVVHFDESGLRVDGRLRWLHVASTEKLTHYHVDKRGHVGMRVAGILPHFKGVAIHDYWRSYFKFRDCRHCLCNVHHLRELRFIVAQYGQAWAAQMERLLLDIKVEVAATSALHTALPPDRLAHYEAVRCAHCPRLRRQPIRSKDKTQTDRPTQTVAAQKPARPPTQT